MKSKKSASETERDKSDAIMLSLFIADYYSRYIAVAARVITL